MHSTCIIISLNGDENIREKHTDIDDIDYVTGIGNSSHRAIATYVWDNLCHLDLQENDIVIITIVLLICMSVFKKSMLLNQP